MPEGRQREVLDAALSALADPAIAAPDKLEMLVAMAVDLQTRPRSADELRGALQLYEKAEGLCPPEDVLLAARIRARKATALQALPGDGPDTLSAAAEELRCALPVLEAQGTAEETAEAEMNLGLVLQALVGMSRARITDAIAAYHRALRTFSAAAHPVEFAILHNNLATAYLSIPLSDERAKMREALAVQSFEHALQVINGIDHPSEFAMLQNNLGNALQYASSSHVLENNVRALAAYDAALQIRNGRDTPVPYANTIANKANALRNLPDDLEAPGEGNADNLARALGLYREAERIFLDHGELERGRMVREAAEETAAELTAQGGSVPREAHDFGSPRVS